MKTLALVFLSVLLATQPALAQLSAQNSNVEETVRKLVQGKKEEIKVELAELEKLSHELKELSHSLKNQEAKMSRAGVLVFSGLFGVGVLPFVRAYRSLHSDRSPMSARAVVMYSVATVASLVAIGVGAGMGKSSEEKISKLKKAILKTELAISRYRAELVKDEASLADLEVAMNGQYR